MHTAMVVEHLKAHEKDAIARLIEWLRIPSVSTDPAYRADVARAGEWCAARLREAGFETKVMPTGKKETPGHPVVMATTPGDASYAGPHVLFYGHYDVQPAEPLELWESPPYEPVIRPAKGAVGERIVARGSCDDKGQVATFLEAMLAWKEVSGKTAGGVRMTVLIEGEEESGSANLEKFVEENAKALGACDVCVISDTGMLGRGRPAITYGVRGLVYTEITLHGPDQDLHSGLWGGRAPNPVNELAKVLAQLWDEDRRVTIPGFYNDVRPITEDERAQWKKLGVSAAESLATIGLGPEADVGEAGFTAIEREWARPICDVNGIYGGYMGKGAKTVIASKATAKVSFRLVADQQPERVAEAFFAWLNQRTPAGCRWELTNMSGGHPVTTPTDSGALRAAVAALRDASGADAALIKSGGSIPIAGMLKDKLGLDTIFMGFGLEDDRVHSPNEKFELDCFRLGMESHARLIEKLWQIGR